MGVRITNKFAIDEDNKHISIHGLVDHSEFDKIRTWCYNQGESFTCYLTAGIGYRTDADLTLFLLRWE
jgi:hypothetical protein